jgi:hypothetical protein
MNFIVASGLLSFTYLVALLLLMELGRRRGQGRLAADPDKGLAGIGVIEGSVLGLYGLLIAFAFGGSMTRFNERKHLIIEEANAVGTAWLRLDILPDADQPPIRTAFRNYMAERMTSYKIVDEGDEATKQEDRVGERKQELWSKVVAVYKRDGFTSSGTSLLSALNSLYDLGDKRINVRRKHMPIAIFLFLLSLGLIAALMGGMSLAEAKSRNWLYAIGFALINAIAIHFIMDIEYPRHGMIRVDVIDHILDDAVNRLK